MDHEVTCPRLGGLTECRREFSKGFYTQIRPRQGSKNKHDNHGVFAQYNVYNYMSDEIMPLHAGQA